MTRELAPGRRLIVLCGGALVVALVLTAVGPYDTHGGMPMGTRLVYWLSLTSLAFFQMIIAVWALAFVRPLAGWPSYAVTALAAVIVAAPLAAEADFVLHAIGPPECTADCPHGLVLYAQALVLLLPVSLPFAPLMSGLAGMRPSMAVAGSAARVAAEQPPSPAPRSPFLDRLPAKLGDELVCLQAEGHYLRAHTALGSDLLRMRMNDAVLELNGADGLRVHRSWWVSLDHVAGVERASRRRQLVLSNGLRVPVGETYRTAVQERLGANGFA